jgi:dinuclear metal center YbgI/SA1388 family protein
MRIADLCDFLDSFAPPRLAAEWDNVGLLVGDRSQPAERVMTCLTLTGAVAAEAVRELASLIVTHHPLPFQPLRRITADDPAGRILLALIRAGVAVYSPHTAFDSAAAGINQQLAEGLGLVEIEPLCRVCETHLKESEGALHAPYEGTGRQGKFSSPLPLAEVAARLKGFLQIAGLHVVGDPARPIERAAIACGSGGELLDDAARANCQLLVTGETRLHTCYEAQARGLALLLAGHYASERFGVEKLAEILAGQFPSLRVWASRDESDPLTWL